MIRVNSFTTIPDTMTVLIEGAESLEGFKALVQRGAQTWADAPAEIKTVADLITNGQEMQPYASMSGEKK